MKVPSILIVDDEPDNFDVIEALLNQQNYQLHYVASGHDAIAYLESFDPDLILLDVMMPGIDGINVCRQIKALPKWNIVPIIMITSLSSKSDLARCLSAGANDFISKPINGLELRARVESMLRIKQQYDDIQSLYQVQNNTIQILESNLNTLNGNLASTLAHELNTPLNGIIGTIDFLRSNIDTLPISDVKEMLVWIDESAQRLGTLTQKFRLYLELQLFPKSPQPKKSMQAYLSPSDIQSNIIAQADKFDRRDDISLTLDTAKIALSEKYISIVFSELADNALKFSDSGTQIHIASKIDGNTLHLYIKDYGRGMNSEQIDRVAAFIQFERDTYEQQGIGLGLRIVQKIVELADGEFSINSIYQEETTVHIALPIIQ